MKVQRRLPLVAEEFTIVSHNAVKKSHITQVAFFFVSVSDPTKVLAY